MPADTPTILATSGGLRRGRRTEVEFSPLVLHAIELSGVTGRAPRLCHAGTAGGDQRWFQAWLSDAGRAQGRALYQRVIADGTLPDGWATDDGTGLLYRGTEMAEALSEVKGKGTYRVTRDGDKAREERIEPRLLPGAEG